MFRSECFKCLLDLQNKKSVSSGLFFERRVSIRRTEERTDQPFFSVTGREDFWFINNVLIFLFFWNFKGFTTGNCYVSNT